MLIPLMLPPPNFIYSNPSTVAIKHPPKTHNVARAARPLDVYVIGDREVHGSAPPGTQTGEGIIACTAILLPEKPLQVGMTIRLVPVRRHCVMTSSIRPSHFEYKAYRPVIGGEITTILSNERHTITFLVKNTFVVPSPFAYAHLSISFLQGTTVHLGILSRLHRIVRRYSLPNSRIVPIDTCRYPTIDFTDLDGTSPPEDGNEYDLQQSEEGSYRASPCPTDPGPYPVDVSNNSREYLLSDAFNLIA